MAATGFYWCNECGAEGDLECPGGREPRCPECGGVCSGYNDKRVDDETQEDDEDEEDDSLDVDIDEEEDDSLDVLIEEEEEDKLLELSAL